MIKLIYIAFGLLTALLLTSMFKSPKTHAEQNSVHINKEQRLYEYKIWSDNNRYKDKIVIDSIKQKLNVH